MRRDPTPNALRFERLDAGLTLRDLSDATGLPLSTVLRLDHGESVHLGTRDAEAIANILGVPVGQLFTSEGGDR